MQFDSWSQPGVAACVKIIPPVAIDVEEGVFVEPLVCAVLFGWCSEGSS